MISTQAAHAFEYITGSISAREDFNDLQVVTRCEGDQLSLGMMSVLIRVVGVYSLAASRLLLFGRPHPFANFWRDQRLAGAYEGNRITSSILGNEHACRPPGLCAYVLSSMQFLNPAFKVAPLIIGEGMLGNIVSSEFFINVVRSVPFAARTFCCIAMAVALMKPSPSFCFAVKIRCVGRGFAI